jgi:hypothetical protein
VLGRAFGTEEVDLGADSQDEVVVRDRREVLELDLACLQVDRADGCAMNGGVVLMADEIGSECPTAVVSRRPVASWYSSGWNVW